MPGPQSQSFTLCKAAHLALNTAGPLLAGPMLTDPAATLVGSTTLPHHVWSYSLMLSPEMGASY